MQTEQLPGELIALFDNTQDIRFVEKGTYLFHEGDSANELYMLKSGQVKISKLSNDGNELTLRHSAAGDLIGELSLIEGQVDYILNAQMIHSGEVAVMPKNALKEKLLENSVLALEFIQLMSKYTNRDQTRFRDLVLFGKKGALYSTLIRLSNSYGRADGGDIHIGTSMTDQKLADFCGTSRESINRLMSELKKKQIISSEKGYITIHKLDYLKEEIHCADCPVDLCSIH